MLNGLVYPLAGPDFFLNPFKDKNVGIYGHTNRKDKRGQARNSERHRDKRKDCQGKCHIDKERDNRY